jgi:hypothetical protein
MSDTNGYDMNLQMTRQSLEAAGFDGFSCFEQLRNGTRAPEAGGPYIVLRVSPQAPEFLEESCGGHFKGRNPTVPVEVLKAKWVGGAEVVLETLRREGSSKPLTSRRCASKRTAGQKQR